MAEKKAFPLAPVVLGVLAVLAVGGYLLTRRAAPAPAPGASPTMNAAETAALARVKELESRLAALEAEKVAAEQKAAEEAKKVIEAQAKARGRRSTPRNCKRRRTRRGRRRIPERLSNDRESQRLRRRALPGDVGRRERHRVAARASAFLCGRCGPGR